MHTIRTSAKKLTDKIHQLVLEWNEGRSTVPNLKDEITRLIDEHLEPAITAAGAASIAASLAAQNVWSVDSRTRLDVETTRELCSKAVAALAEVTP